MITARSCLHLRSTVVTAGVQKELWFALGVLAPLFVIFAHRAATVTSLAEGDHLGFAAEVDTTGLTGLQRRSILQVALTVLDPLGFNIEDHDSDQHGRHLRIHYAPRPGHTFPEPTNREHVT